jgi:hypothetical protein
MKIEGSGSGSLVRGMDPRIRIHTKIALDPQHCLRHSGIRGAPDEAVFKKVGTEKKNQKHPPLFVCRGRASGEPDAVPELAGPRDA